MNVSIKQAASIMNGGAIMNNVTLTIFGGTGDLTYRKLLPALYNLYVSHQKTDIKIVIIGRRAYDHESYCDIIQPWIKQFVRLPYRDAAFHAFCDQLYYYQMDFTDEGAYEALHMFYQKHDMSHHIFYLAVAPRFFDVIAKGLRYVKDASLGNVVIEKPFGEDLSSAKRLNKELEAFFTPHHVYHIDHYLGKEMVRNIQAIRFLNPIFSNIWNHEYIEHVQINAMEEVGVENRGSYYDHSGALKDMVQNHLFQILSIIAMEPMEQFTRDDMHDKQLQVLKSLRPVSALRMEDTMVLGQYFDYQKEASVSNDSETETYAALRLFIDQPRWKDTPFYIRTGKKLDRREMEVIITFKRVMPNVDPNILIIKIQPNEGVYVQFNIKKPGNSEDIIPASMDFCQSCLDINRINTPEAYERLLLAVMQEDSSWFSKWDQIETSWQYVDELKQRYYEENLPVYAYPSYSAGPKEADMLLSKHHHTWQKS